MSARPAFTLTEILMAIMIFMIVSTAMIGVFNQATTLFQNGQTARAANDEAMAILTRLDLDCAAAVGPDGGGHYYTWLDDNGNCAVGWTVRRGNPGPYQDHLGFVLYGVIGDQLRRREVEIDRNGRPRIVVADANDLPILSAGGFGLNSPLGMLDDPASGVDEWTAAAAVLSNSCHHFGIWLTGTTHVGDLNSVVPATNPGATDPLARTTYWHLVSDLDGNEAGTEPSGTTGPEDLHYYTTLEAWNDGTVPTYPSAARFTLILGGGNASGDGDQVRMVGEEGRLRSISDTHIAVRGMTNMVASQGSLVRIGNHTGNQEWIGVHGQDGQGLLINEENAWDQGPLGPDNDGRAALRSIRHDHDPGARVVAGRLFTLVKRLRY